MSQTGVVSWSKTAATNSTADSSVNFSEGMAPSAVNDSCRAALASVAMWRDDTNGTITTGGTLSAYSITTNQTFAALTAGYTIAFCPNVTSGATPTLNVDTLGAKPLRPAPGIEFSAGALQLGVPYVATYFTSNSGEWIVHASPSAWTTGDVKTTFKTAADVGWVLLDDKTLGDASSSATGRANADTAALFSVLWTNISDTYAPVSTGRGLTAAADYAAHKTITLPKALGRLFGASGAGSGLTARALGETLGAETTTIDQTNLPAANLTTIITDTGHDHTISGFKPSATIAGTVTGAANSLILVNDGTTLDNALAASLTGISAVTQLGGSGVAIDRHPPTLFLNAMIKL